MSPSTCESIAEELVAYLDGELSEPARAHIQSHLGSCLTCRREMERLVKLAGWLRTLPRAEPRDDLARRMQDRLAVERRSGAARGWSGHARWAAPLLAIAAAMVMVVYSSLTALSPVAPSRAGRVNDVIPAKEGESVRRAGGINEPRQGAEEDATVAEGAQPFPEDLPQELLAHPELFLRLPVVRRLEKLEHFEEVRGQGDSDKSGARG